MGTAVPWHALLFLVDVQVCPSFCSPHFLLLCSPSLVDGDNVPVFVFEPAQLLDEFVDHVVARETACVSGSSRMWPRRGCRLGEQLVVLRFYLGGLALCVGLVVVFRDWVNVECPHCVLYFHGKADRYISTYCSVLSSSSSFASPRWQGVAFDVCRGAVGAGIFILILC